MKRVVNFLQMDVKIKTSHLWMVALGVVIALGFAINCVVYPFYGGCNPVDPEQLILAASIVAGLGTARQLVLYRFKYLSGLQNREPKKISPESILKERLWVPAIGWFLAFGFAVNMVIIPFFPQIREIDWSFLQSSIGIFLTISGAREIGLYSQGTTPEGKDEETTEEDN